MPAPATSLKLQDFLEALEAYAKIRNIVRPKPSCMRIGTTAIHMVHPLYDRAFSVPNRL